MTATPSTPRAFHGKALFSNLFTPIINFIVREETLKMPSYAYFHKQFVPLSEAKLGIMTHCLHYGTAAFEGIRGNWNSQQKQLYLFRLK